MADRPQLTQVNLIVGDMEAAVDFYRRLGLDVPSDDGTSHIEIPGASDDGPVFELDGLPSAQLWNASARSRPGDTPVVLGFSFPSREAVDDTYDALTSAGHRGVQPPFDAFWGGRYAIVADPAGNQVGLMSPRDDEHRSWPPAPSPDPT